MRLSRRQRPERQSNQAPLTPADQGWTPFHELARLRSELQRALFQVPYETFIAPAAGFFQGWTPAFDLYEEKDKFIIKAEVPGMKRENIDVSVHGNTLTISGERKEEEEHKESDVHRSERYFGRFQRNITLPSAIDAGKISASYHDGILNITLPKTEEAKGKRIEIKPA